MRIQFAEKRDIKNEIISSLGDKIPSFDFSNLNSNKINYLITFEKSFRGVAKPISFYRTFFIRDDTNIEFNIVKVNSIKLDNKYYYCGFKSLPDADYYNYVIDELLIKYGWVENNKKILYMDLKAFIILYKLVSNIKKNKCDLLDRILFSIVDIG